MRKSDYDMMIQKQTMKPVDESSIITQDENKKTKDLNKYPKKTNKKEPEILKNSDPPFNSENCTKQEIPVVNTNNSTLSGTTNNLNNTNNINSNNITDSYNNTTNNATHTYTTYIINSSPVEKHTILCDYICETEPGKKYVKKEMIDTILEQVRPIARHFGEYNPINNSFVLNDFTENDLTTLLERCLSVTKEDYKDPHELFEVSCFHSNHTNLTQYFDTNKWHTLTLDQLFDVIIPFIYGNILNSIEFALIRTLEHSRLSNETSHLNLNMQMIRKHFKLVAKLDTKPRCLESSDYNIMRWYNNERIGRSYQGSRKLCNEMTCLFQDIDKDISRTERYEFIRSIKDSIKSILIENAKYVDTYMKKKMDEDENFKRVVFQSEKDHVREQINKEVLSPVADIFNRHKPYRTRLDKRDEIYNENKDRNFFKELDDITTLHKK